MADDIIELDFTGAPPSEGPSFSDHIPAGVYDLKIGKAESMTSGTGKPMVVVNFRVAGGQETGKKLVDFFVIPRSKEESKVGLSRLHQLLVACGSKEIPGRTKINLGQLANRVCRAEVEDNEMPASGNYPARMTSRPARYLRRETLAAGGAPAPAPAQAASAPKPAPKPAAPTPVAAPVPAVEEAPFDETSQEVGVASADSIASKVADDLDALFGS